MSQYDFGTIDPNVMSGTALAGALNEFRDALHSLHRGEIRPTYVRPGMLWIMEVSATRWDIMLYTGADDMAVRSLNPETNTWRPIPIAAGGTGATTAAAARQALAVDPTTLDKRYAVLEGANNFDQIPTVNGAAFVTLTAFYKEFAGSPAWTVDGATTLETLGAIDLAVGGTLLQIPAGTPVSIPTLTNGTDYNIYAYLGGSLAALEADAPAPAEARLVGGFHAFDAGDGSDARSLWDLNWRPDCPNPRAMVLSPDDRTWVDIYMMDVEYGLHGYSRLGQQIADDGDRPIIPDMYGGDGVATYGSMSWWESVELAAAASKRLPTAPEFKTFAHGVVENQSVGTDPGTTQHQAGHRSACGVEQATGVMWQRGADIQGNAVLLGGYWSSGSSSSSRHFHWSVAPGNSHVSYSARAVCDHLNLQVAA